MTTVGGEFEAQVRDLLSNLYDYLKLAENPAAQGLAKDKSGNERMNIVRQTVLDAIEDLRREDKQNPTARANRLYNILQLRYVEEQSTTAVLNQLALSERQYYREHQRAIQTVSRIIWDNHFAETGAESDGPAQSLSAELDYLNVGNSHGAFQPRAELMAAVVAMQTIARQRRIELDLEGAREAFTLNVSQPVFRQFVIYLLNELIGATAIGGKIRIGLRMEAGAPTLTISNQAPLKDGAGFCARLREDGTASELTKHLKADLRWEEQASRIEVAFEGEMHSILIVDDNPDTIRLFKRYLANLPYRLLAARGEREALAIARSTPLLCVILDVMLPGADGWQILQSYKSHPATADIPVMICSVLEMEELAASLGADGYLKKPPARAEFLSILSQWVE